MNSSSQYIVNAQEWKNIEETCKFYAETEDEENSKIWKDILNNAKPFENKDNPEIPKGSVSFVLGEEDADYFEMIIDENAPWNKIKNMNDLWNFIKDTFKSLTEGVLNETDREKSLKPLKSCNEEQSSAMACLLYQIQLSVTVQKAKIFVENTTETLTLLKDRT